MGNLQNLTSFSGSLTVDNIGIYLMIMATLYLRMRDFAGRTQVRPFGTREEEAANTTFKYPGTFKPSIIAICFTPWLALKLMA